MRSKIALAILFLACAMPFSDKIYAQNTQPIAMSDVCSNDGKSEPNAFFDTFKKLGRGETVYFGGREIPASADGYWQKEHGSNIGSRSLQRKEKCGPYVRDIKIVEYSKSSSSGKDETRIENTIVSCSQKIKYSYTKYVDGVGLSNSRVSDLNIFNTGRAKIEKAETHSTWWNNDYVDACADITYPDNPELATIGLSLDSYATSNAYDQKIADERDKARQERRREELAQIDRYSIIIVCEKGYYAGVTRTLGEHLVDVRKGRAPPQVFSESMKLMKDHCVMGSWPVKNPDLLWNKDGIGSDENFDYYVTSDNQNATPNIVMIRRYKKIGEK